LVNKQNSMKIFSQALLLVYASILLSVCGGNAGYSEAH
jgi:hypothetical protein